MNRRNFLSATPIAAVALAAPAAAFAVSPDHAILAAWDRRVAAVSALEQLDAAKEGLTERAGIEAKLCKDLDAAEDVIRSTTARTPAGAAVQIWAMLAHSIGGLEENAAIERRDLAFFEVREGDLDWNERLAIAALRSLRAMG